MKELIKEHLKYRIDKAKRYMQIFENGLKTGITETYPHTLYYACLYLVVALMQTRGFQFKTHTGLKNEFLKLYVKTGKIDYEFGDFFKEIFLFRQENDYDIVNIPDESTILEFLNKAKDFAKVIELQIDEELKIDN